MHSGVRTYHLYSFISILSSISQRKAGVTKCIQMLAIKKGTNGIHVCWHRNRLRFCFHYHLCTSFFPENSYRHHQHHPHKKYKNPFHFKLLIAAIALTAVCWYWNNKAEVWKCCYSLVPIRRHVPINSHASRHGTCNGPYRSHISMPQKV